MKALEVRQVSKSFGGLKVIENLSFDVGRGERLALIGPNGAGKTTIFNLITGVYPVDSGAVVLDGRDITRLASRQRIRHGLARTFQNIRLMPHLSVLENAMITQYARAPGVATMFQPVGFGRHNRWREEARAALADAGLESFANEAAGALPYGVQKRIELVRALLAAPRVLLLDEPAAGLNPAETVALQRSLEAIAARGITLVVVEHDMHFVGRLCERVVVLNFGVKIAECAPAEIHADARVREAYLGAEDHAA
jgi:ABC-type branched-subunit amino acid transport system ATPase component